MHAAVAYLVATALSADIVTSATKLESAVSQTQAKTARGESVRVRKVPKTYGLYFPRVAVPSSAGIGLIRVVVTCGHIAAIVRIPDDWYVRTLRPALESDPEWSDFQFAWSAVEFEAGHGVTRLPVLRPLDGAIRVAVDDATCFDVTADIADDMGTDWKTRLQRRQLRLRN